MGQAANLKLWLSANLCYEHSLCVYIDTHMIYLWKATILVI